MKQFSTLNEACLAVKTNKDLEEVVMGPKSFSNYKGKVNALKKLFMEVNKERKIRRIRFHKNFLNIDCCKVIAKGMSSLVETSCPIATGASLTGVTVNTNVSSSVPPLPSFTVTVIVTSPWKSNPGVMVNWSPATETATLFVSLLTALKIKD